MREYHLYAKEYSLSHGPRCGVRTWVECNLAYRTFFVRMLKRSHRLHQDEIQLCPSCVSICTLELLDQMEL